MSQVSTTVTVHATSNYAHEMRIDWEKKRAFHPYWEGGKALVKVATEVGGVLVVRTAASLYEVFAIVEKLEPSRYRVISVS